MGLRDVWYKNAIIYAIDVKSFMDSDGDGVGDFRGLTSQVEYLAQLGVDCLWLLPFYESPDRDNGYDVTDHYAVDPRLGSPGDVVEFLREAHGRGIRVLVDLVANHTSDQHPWFRAAQRDPTSRYRDFYVWADEPPKQAPSPVFKGKTPSTWTWNARAGQYYFHHFYAFEPGLNLANPQLRAEIHRIMGYWLALGVDGFRVDAAPFLVRPKGPAAPPADVLKNFHHFAMRRHAGAVLLAEANVTPWRKLTAYFGDGDEMQLLFSFPSASDTFLALAQEDGRPVAALYDRDCDKPRAGQWVNFLRNLDELDLEHLPARDRRRVLDTFAPDEDMRIYGRGIRRRLAPILGGDGPRLRLALSLVFSYPGSPCIVYGDEIGMGDDLRLSGRSVVRTPMQWTAERNAGFSDASPRALLRPVITAGPFAYTRVNVEHQSGNPDSLLHFVRRLIAVRKQCPEFGVGNWRSVATGDPSVVGIRCEWQSGVCYAFHNLSREARVIAPDLWADSAATGLHELLADHDYDPLPREPTPRIPFAPSGFRWFRVGGVQRDRTA